IWSCWLMPAARWNTIIAVVDSMPVNRFAASDTSVASAPPGRYAAASLRCTSESLLPALASGLATSRKSTTTTAGRTHLGHVRAAAGGEGRAFVVVVMGLLSRRLRVRAAYRKRPHVLMSVFYSGCPYFAAAAVAAGQCPSAR